MSRKLNVWMVSFFLLLFLSGGTILAEPERAALEKALAEENGTKTIYLPLTLNGPPPQTVFGVELVPITNGAGLEQMSNAGTSWVRRNGVLWSAVEPVQGGGYDWSALENLEEDLLRARSHDMEVILIVRSTPAWATVPPYHFACGPISLDALPFFGNFMHEVVKRYSGAPYYVKHYEIWNEPDVDPKHISNGLGTWGCMGDARDPYYGGQNFATILQTVYPMVKAADPEAKVIIGGLLLFCNPDDPPVIFPNSDCTPSKYLAGILEAGAADSFDGVAFHAYDYFSIGPVYPNGIYGNLFWNSGGGGANWYGDLKPGLVAKAQYLRNLLTTYGAADKFLVNTETGLLCGAIGDPPGGPGCEATDTSPFEKLKAAYVVQSYSAAIAENLLTNIWYTALGWRNSGLLYDDLTPRPAYEAYVLARKTLKDATFVREVNEFSGDLIFGYEFLVSEKKIWVLWALDGKPHTISLPTLPDTAFDELGAPVDAGNGNLTIEELKTVYVDWGQ